MRSTSKTRRTLRLLDELARPAVDFERFEYEMLAHQVQKFAIQKGRERAVVGLQLSYAFHDCIDWLITLAEP